MKYLVPLLLLLFTLGFWLAVDQNSDVGKNPGDEVVVHSRERNLVTGELLNVEIVRCRLCGQVLCYIQSSLTGKVRKVYFHAHHCGRYQTTPIAYNGSALWLKDFNLIKWLDYWQQRLKVKR